MINSFNYTLIIIPYIIIQCQILKIKITFTSVGLQCIFNFQYFNEELYVYTVFQDDSINAITFVLSITFNFD